MARQGKAVRRRVGSDLKRRKRASRERQTPRTATAEGAVAFEGGRKISTQGKYARVGLASTPLQDTEKAMRAKKAVVGKEKVLPEAPPPMPIKPTELRNKTSEQSIRRIQLLVRRHKTNVAAMAKDRTLNPYQLTEAQLRRKIIHYLREEALVSPDSADAIEHFERQPKKSF